MTRVPVEYHWRKGGYKDDWHFFTWSSSHVGQDSFCGLSSSGKRDGIRYEEPLEAGCDVCRWASKRLLRHC
jgi:hypothetical protein